MNGEILFPKYIYYPSVHFNLKIIILAFYHESFKRLWMSSVITITADCQVLSKQSLEALWSVYYNTDMLMHTMQCIYGCMQGSGAPGKSRCIPCQSHAGNMQIPSGYYTKSHYRNLNSVRLICKLARLRCLASGLYVVANFSLW